MNESIEIVKQSLAIGEKDLASSKKALEKATQDHANGAVSVDEVRRWEQIVENNKQAVAKMKTRLAEAQAATDE